MQKALTEYMRVTGMTQVELAERCEVNPTQLNAWIKQRRDPTAANLKQISEKTGIKLEKLLADM